MFVIKKHIIQIFTAVVLSASVPVQLSAQEGFGSLELSGNAYVSPDTISLFTNDLSIDLWAFKDVWQAQNKEVLLSYQALGGWELCMDNTHLRFTAKTSVGEKILTHPLLDMTPGWHHIAVTTSSQYIRLFVDGSQRDYFYLSSGFNQIRPIDSVLIVGAESYENGNVVAGWHGEIDELRIWKSNLSASEISEQMHLPLREVDNTLLADLLVGYSFLPESPMKGMGGNGEFCHPLVKEQNTVISASSPPLSPLYEGFTTDPEAYWSIYVNNIYSEASGGLHLAVTNGNQFELDEFGVMGHNNGQGVSTHMLVNDVDVVSKRCWYYSANHDYETMAFRFDMSDAEAIGVLANCLSYASYKLLYKAALEDSFHILKDAYMLDGDNLFFYDVVAKDGFYAVGRDNDVPFVETAQVTNVSGVSAIGGGTVLCSGGADVTQYGVCWSLSTEPTIDDSISVDGTGMGPFSSQIQNLVPGCSYYIRAYAINSEGVGYGEEILIKTNKLNQSVIFPLIDSKTFGDEAFYPGAYATSGLPINYRSSNEAVAVIIDGKIQIVGVGSTIIWANQPGNISYNASTFRKVTLLVSKANQEIQGSEIISLCYGDSFRLDQISASSGLMPLFTFADSSFISIEDSVLIMRKVGRTSMTAVQPGDAHYLASPEKTIQIEVKKKDIFISMLTQNVVYDGEQKQIEIISPLDSLNFVVLYNNDTVLPLGAGSYKVKAMVDDEEYEGEDSTTFVIEKAVPEIQRWPDVGGIFKGESLESSYLENGLSDVEGEFRFRQADYVPAESGELIELDFVPFDSANFKIVSSLSSIQFHVITNQSTLNKEPRLDIYPTVSNGLVSVDGYGETWELSIFSLSGKLVLEKKYVDDKCKLDLTHLRNGVYVVKCSNETTELLKKIIIK